MLYFQQERIIKRKITNLDWVLVGMITLCCVIGIALLFSAARGSFHPWALRQFYLCLVLIPVMIFIGLMDIRTLYDSAYILYAVGVILLVVAEIMGHTAMGAQRWIRLGFINFQPSELMKLFIILALARFFHVIHSSEVGQIKIVAIPLLMLAIPVLLILKQPNLGTSTIILMIGGAIFFMGGVKAWKFITVIVLGCGALPVVWHLLHDYQRQRILTFLDPETDPLGAGYNIMQSMIAIGSGGFFGKGYLNGSQSQLNFLPEKQTDFIFTLIAEEFGFFGVFLMLGLYIMIMGYGYLIAISCRNQFCRLVAIGVTTMLAVHLIINIAMVSGAIPVVGTPLPFLSFGGSNLMTMLVGYGLLLCASLNRDERLEKS